MQRADECKRLLDNGWALQLYKDEETGGYRAVALPPSIVKVLDEMIEEENSYEEVDEIAECEFGGYDEMDDKFTIVADEPSKALYRLTEQVFGARK